MLKAHGYRESVRAIADRIDPIEQTFDEAIELQASLLAETPKARRRAGIGPSVTQDAMTRMSAALATTVAARGEFLAAHRAFAEIYDSLGIDVTGTGSGKGCPSDMDFFTSGEDRLRVVA